jgi:putative RecB family exonuclease
MDSIEAFVGSRVHEALELLYKDLKVSKLNTLEDLIKFYSSTWEKSWHKDVKIIKKNYSKENYFDLGSDCITKFYNRYQPFNQANTLGTELGFTLTLDEDNDYKLTGFIDRIDQRLDGTYEIHDYKTSGFLPEQLSLDEDRQLALYQIAIKEKFNDADNVELIWHYLAFDKEFKSARSDDQLDELRTQIIELIQKIEATSEFAPKESALCEWCEFQDLCPKRKHYFKVDTLQTDEFLNETGVSLVNRYVLLEAKKSEVNEYLERVETEITKVKKALVEYGKKDGMDVIKGSNKKARIKTDIKLSFPLKKDPMRPHLDQLIRESGKWDEVSDLNPWLLARVIKGGKWSNELIGDVKSFAKEEQSISVYLSTLSERERVEG